MTMNCPFCGGDNIEGADQCMHCEQPLDFLSAPAANSEVERGLLRDKVRLIASRRPVLVTQDQPVRDMLRAMVAQSVGCVVVVDRSASDGHDVIGMFSERDALVRLGADVGRLGDLPVSQFMTPSPETIDGDAEIAFALQKMDVGGYRHLPVIERGRVAGVVSIRDILQYVSVHLEAVE